MALIVKDRVRETSTTTGTGTITLGGAFTGFRSFADIGNGNTTYYCISGGSQFEVGIGTYTASGTTLSRDTVLSNSLGTTALINFSAGTKDVFVTYPSDKALLGTTGAVASTGTGSVVLNNNPSFATDITVNGAKVGRGGGSVSSNLAFGTTPLNSPFITSNNTNLVAIGNNTLPLVGKGVATLNLFSQGLDYYDVSSGTDTFSATATLTYLSGTPVMSGGTYPEVSVDVIGGAVSSFTITSGGSGFPSDTSSLTYFTLNLGADYTSTENAQFNAITYASGNNLIAIGNNAGSNSKTNNNSIYLGYGATGTGSNEIVIGADATGLGDNTAVIGNTSTTSTTLRGSINAAGSISLTATAGTVSIGGSVTSGAINIGGSAASATGLITLGRSTGTQTVGIATGANGNGVTKTVNIGTGTNNSSSTTNVNVGGTVGGGTLTFGQSTSTQTVNIANGANASPATKTVNIGTNASTGTTNIAIGATGGTSTTTVNGTLRQQTFLVANLPTGVAGARSFVTNALSPTFGAAVAGGGSVGVPVYHDGTSWKVG